jgi:hypothetical protein
VGPGTAAGTTIVFPVQATAQQVRRVVADDLREAVRGKSLADARSTLEAYGTTTISLWPGFASSIPSYDFRIDLTVKSDIVVETGSPAPGSSTAPRPSASGGRPRASGSSEPGPSGSPKASPKATPKPPKATASPRLEPVARSTGERRSVWRSRTRTAPLARPLTTIRRARIEVTIATNRVIGEQDIGAVVGLPRRPARMPQPASPDVAEAVRVTVGPDGVP